MDGEYGTLMTYLTLVPYSPSTLYIVSFSIYLPPIKSKNLIYSNGPSSNDIKQLSNKLDLELKTNGMRSRSRVGIETSP